MVKGVSLFRTFAFLKRGKTLDKKTSEEDSVDSLPESAATSNKSCPCLSGGHSRRYRTISGSSTMSTASCHDVQKKKNPRIRTISGSSGCSTQSEPNTPGQRRQRVRTISGGSNFSGDSIVTHLDQLSQRDQLCFQAFRFGGR